MCCYGNHNLHAANLGVFYHSHYSTSLFCNINHQVFGETLGLEPLAIITLEHSMYSVHSKCIEISHMIH